MRQIFDIKPDDKWVKNGLNFAIWPYFAKNLLSFIWSTGYLENLLHIFYSYGGRFREYGLSDKIRCHAADDSSARKLFGFFFWTSHIFEITVNAV